MTHRITALLSVTLALSASSGVDRFLVKNDAVGATDFLEGSGQGYQTVEPKMQYWLCHGYAELRRFNDCFGCMVTDRLSMLGEIKTGDDVIGLARSFFMSAPARLSQVG